MARVNFKFLLLFIISSNFAMKFKKCELVRELSRQEFPEYLMKDLICLVEVESSFQTHLKRDAAAGDSYNWGLFQINDRLWCSSGSPGKRCNVRCEDLLTDNISAAARCAQMIIFQRGLSYWQGWVDHCKNKFLPDIDCTPIQTINAFLDII